MRRAGGRVRGAALVVATMALFGGLAGCDFSCPAALLEGVLVRSGDALVVHAEYGDEKVRWPFGYSVGTDGDRLVVKDLFGSVKAREGDTVHLGGGMVPPNDEAFGVCGSFRVDPG